MKVVGGFRRKKGKKKIRVRDKLMDWWHKMVFPVRRIWVSVSARVKARKNGPFLITSLSLLIIYVCFFFLIFFFVGFFGLMIHSANDIFIRKDP